MRKTDFDHYKQMDSQEFILQLLDVLHEDVNAKGHLKVTGSPSVTSTTPDHIAAKLWYDHYKRNNESVFYELFHVSVLVFLKKKQTKHYSIFWFDSMVVWLKRLFKTLS